MAGFDMSDYIPVAERITKFYAANPGGRIVCDLPLVVTIGGNDHVQVTARAYRDHEDIVAGQGTAWEPYPGKTPYTKESEMMNAETAAAGRAVIMAGIPSGRSMASREEVQGRQPEPTITPAQLEHLQKRLRALPDDIRKGAADLIKHGPLLRQLPAGLYVEAEAFVELCELQAAA